MSDRASEDGKRVAGSVNESSVVGEWMNENENEKYEWMSAHGNG